MTTQQILLPDNIDVTIFYGVNNANMLTLKNLCPQLKLMARGHTIKIQGLEDDVETFRSKIEHLIDYCVNTNTLTEADIVTTFRGETKVAHIEEKTILFGVSGKTITARTENQQKLVDSFDTNDLLFAVGPAGSGKTYTAIALAVKALKEKMVKRIILSRPAVEAGEKLGFLPGDMRDKIDPYLQPLYDALQDMISPAKLTEYMESGVIQIAPLAFMRGRTLNNAVIILDEAQNTNVPQIKMFLTRLGIHAKMIITGDLTQIDLPSSQKSGLKDALEVLRDIKGVRVIEFDKQDIVRHRLVQSIVDAYSKRDNDVKKKIE